MPAKPPTPTSRQLLLRLGEAHPPMEGLTPEQKAEVVRRLARLLLEASQIERGEDADEG